MIEFFKTEKFLKLKWNNLLKPFLLKKCEQYSDNSNKGQSRIANEILMMKILHSQTFEEEGKRLVECIFFCELFFFHYLELTNRWG
jgi:hypothetical protein